MTSIRSWTPIRWVLLGALLLGIWVGCGGGSAAPPSLPEPSITSFGAAQSPITAGTGTTLTAVFANGTGSVDGGIGTVTSGIAMPVSPGSDRTYTLMVTNAAGATATAQALVKVVGTPSITSFGAAQSPITAGTGTTLTAVFANGTGSVDGGVGPITSGAVTPVSPGSDRTYTLTVTNAAGATATAQASVKVVGTPSITSFGAAQSPITAGTGTTLTAVFTNGSGNVDGGVGPITSGAVTPVSPGNDRTYTLTVTNAAGAIATAQASVKVVGTPSITSFGAAQSPITAGTGTTLTAVFTNGSGNVDGGVGPITSGLPIPVSPGGDTTYTLSVTNEGGSHVEAQTTVQVVAGASLSLSLNPTSGTWRVDGGAWMPSGASVGGLALGSHTLEFGLLPYYDPLPSELVTLGTGESRSMERSYVPPTGFYSHRLRFFINQDLVGNLDSATLRSRLSQYAAHIQTIFHRETLRRFIFDPVNDITVCTQSPFSNDIFPPWPDTGFEIWVYAQLTDYEYGTYGGYMSVDISGAGGANGLKWDQIHDPIKLELKSRELWQYCKQLNNIIHELEHTFGAGVGEYYTMNGQGDPTGIEPIVSNVPAINAPDSHPFWDSRKEYLADPLGAEAFSNPKLGYPVSLPEVLASVRFAPATVAVINGLFRDPIKLNDTIPDLSAVVVEILDDLTGLPIPLSTLRVWNRLDQSVTDPTLGFEQAVFPTFTPGIYTFKWEPYPSTHPFSSNVNAKILKAYAPGYIPKAQWEWLYDAQREKCYYGRNEFKVILRLTPLP